MGWLRKNIAWYSVKGNNMALSHCALTKPCTWSRFWCLISIKLDRTSESILLIDRLRPWTESLMVRLGDRVTDHTSLSWRARVHVHRTHFCKPARVHTHPHSADIIRGAYAPTGACERAWSTHGTGEHHDILSPSPPQPVHACAITNLSQSLQGHLISNLPQLKFKVS